MKGLTNIKERIHTNDIHLVRINKEITIIQMEKNSYLFHSSTIRLFKIDAASEKILEYIYNHKIDIYEENTNQVLRRYFPDDQIDDFYSFINGIKSFIPNEIKKNTSINLNQAPGIRSLVLYVTGSCNMNCSYCFEGRERKSVEYMSSRTAREALDFFSKGKDGEKLSVGFFGGEPLLNFDVIRDSILYFSKNRAVENITYSITTNGLLLTKDIFDFLSSYDVRILLSMDGPASVHDKHRRQKNGSASYWKILKNLQYALGKRPELITIRATVTPDIFSLVDVVNHFLNLGVKDIGFDIAVGDYDNGPSWSSENISKYEIMFSEYMKAIFDRIKKGDHVPRHISARIERILRREKTIIPCRMGRELLVAGPSGNYYTCHWFIGNPDFIIGNTDLGISETLRETFSPPLVQEKDLCGMCWIRGLCDGTCPAIMYTRTGSAQSPDPVSCLASKIVWKWNIWLYIKLTEEGISIPDIHPVRKTRNE